jgi:hypothetical protein
MKKEAPVKRPKEPKKAKHQAKKLTLAGLDFDVAVRAAMGSGKIPANRKKQ